MEFIYRLFECFSETNYCSTYLYKNEHSLNNGKDDHNRGFTMKIADIDSKLEDVHDHTAYTK